MKVSKKNHKSQKQRKREQAGRTLPQGSPTTRVPQSSLKMFKTIEPDHMKAVNADDGWEEIEFALDSGATETVMGEDMLNSVETKEGAASKRGVEYEIATGELIPNLEEKKFHHCPGLRSKQGPDERGAPRWDRGKHHPEVGRRTRYTCRTRCSGEVPWISSRTRRASCR